MKIKLTIFIFLLSAPLFAQTNSPNAIIEQELTNWEFRMLDDTVWKPAKVPGTIIDNFIDLNDISNPQHPYYGDNEKLYQWISEKSWQFYTMVQLDSALIKKGYTPSLRFEQLDLFAHVFIGYINYNGWLEDVLNEKPIEISNAFVTQNFRMDMVYHFSPEKFNIEVIVEFIPTAKQLNDKFYEAGALYSTNHSIFARKPAYEFGWDWAPKFVNMGIRKPVKLIMTPPTKTEILPFNFRMSNIGKKNGKLTLDLGVKSELDSLDIHFSIFENGALDRTSIMKYEKNVTSAHLYTINNPRIWWPNTDAKESNYYEFDVKITLPGDTTTIAHKHIYYAVCDIKLVQEKDRYGESFYFTVNGHRVFAKGANYVPDDSFHPGKNSIDLINMAADANMNMIRVWGGGTYPDDEFYIQCMKKGIMVWQDFMFACTMYPGTEDFLSNVANEAHQQVNRLKNYNHIAVWCGNNEIEEGWKNWGWQKQMEIHGEDSVAVWNAYDTLFQKILPEIIAEVNQTDYTHLNYISTSPKHGWGRKESMTEGDSHYWGVWWGLEPIEKYNEKVPRFMSEFGMQGMPDLSTLIKVIPDSSMNFDSPKFKNHQKHPTGFETLNHYLKEYLVVPNNIDDYVYATQVLQAYALTTAIEAQRRAMPYCMGSLVWQLNDCWPVTSWSLIDAELNTKMAYDYVSDSFSPIWVSVKEEKSSYDIYIINDDQTAIHAPVEICLMDFKGNNLWKKKTNAHIPKGFSKKCCSIQKNSAKWDSKNVYVQIRIGPKKFTKISLRMPLARPNQLKLEQPEFNIQLMGQDEKKFVFGIKSNTFCPYPVISYHDQLISIPWLFPNEHTNISLSKKIVGNEFMLEPEMIKCLNTLLKK